jgi:mRNA-degrading endonuclease RelE of RelBE toxin-antitoxin system
MNYEFKPSFEKSLKFLSARDKEEIKDVCLSFIDLIDGKTQIAKGLGLKKLIDDYWEIRKGLELRILFRWGRSSLEFVLAGNHDQIRNFLKNI